MRNLLNQQTVELRMKKVKTIFSPRKIVIWVFLLILAFTIPEFSKPAMSQTEAIVNFMCVDFVDDEFSLSASVLTPADGKKANYTFYSAVGDTLGEAVDSISLSIGKEMGFSQCEVMAFGDALCEKGVISALDFMVRMKKVSRNATLINFGGDIQDFSQAVFKLVSDKQLKLEQILNFDEQYILSKDSSIENFYKNYFNKISTCVLPKISVLKEQTDNAIEVQAGGTSGQEQSTGSTQQQGEEKFYLLNDGSMGVLKKGKKQIELDFKQVKDVNLFVNSDYKGLVVIKNVNDNLYKDATVVMNIVKTKPKISVSFDGEKPIYNFKLTLKMHIEEIVQDEQKLNFMRRNKEFYTDELIKQIYTQVKTNVDNAIDFCKTNKVDLLQVYKYFNAFENQKFKQYVDKVGLDNYLQDIEFKIDLQIDNAF